MMRHLSILILLVLIAPFSFAAEITKVKGSNVLLNLSGESTLPGDVYFAVEGGKKKALIKIVKVKGDKAIAKILKGTAATGMSLERKGGGGSSSEAATTSTPRKSKSSSGSRASMDSRAYWGVLLGFAQDVMSVNVNRDVPPGDSLGTAGLSGSGFSAKGLFDYELFNQVWFRGTTGLEQFNVAGTSICGKGNKEACDAKIMYLSLDFIARYVFMTGGFRPWAGAGVALLFPASKSSTALASSSIGTTNVLIVTGGFDYFISPSMYIPVSVEYGMLPKSNEVDAHWIAARAGVAVPF